MDLKLGVIKFSRQTYPQNFIKINKCVQKVFLLDECSKIHKNRVKPTIVRKCPDGVRSGTLGRTHIIPLVILVFVASRSACTNSRYGLFKFLWRKTGRKYLYYFTLTSLHGHEILPYAGHVKFQNLEKIKWKVTSVRKCPGYGTHAWASSPWTLWSLPRGNQFTRARNMPPQTILEIKSKRMQSLLWHHAGEQTREQSVVYSYAGHTKIQQR